MHESIKTNAFGALWARKEERRNQKAGTHLRREMEEDRGGEQREGKEGEEEQSALLNGNWLFH